MAKLRLVVQMIFTAVSNGYWQGFAEGRIYTGSMKQVCAPGLNCYSCPGALGACPMGALQQALAGRSYSALLYAAGFLFAVGAAAGRAVCGWLCPFGLVQDLLHRIPGIRKIRKVPGERQLRFVKYLLLALLVLLLPFFVLDSFGVGKAWFCQYVCPSGTLMAGIPLVAANAGIRSIIGFLFAWKAVILAVILIASLFIYRPFCRFLCPLGAIYGCFNKIALVRYEIDEQACIGCGACTEACKINIDVVKDPNSPECIRCGSCLAACPQGAIRKGGIKIERKQVHTEKSSGKN